ncbi:MAG: bifunctional heptose 7-phosphate kinase/heptose 1-phosphate adenyltransferase [Fimbriimonas sp.]
MSLAALLDAFGGRRALVVGDLMLDEYIFGSATRISQEAPVMVIRQSGTRAVPGAAANVAANMVALGAQVEVVGVVGDDAAGDTLARSLVENGLGDGGVVRDSSRVTTRKTRVLANHAHQVLRIDHESTDPVEGEVERAVIDRVLDALPRVDVVLVSDYVKGAVTSRAIRTFVEEGRRAGVPVVANPKPRSLPDYRGAALVSLNRFEAADALRLPDGLADWDGESAAAELRERLGVDNLVVTLGASGMAAAGPEGTSFAPAVRVEVYDEAGAGDTVIATIALGVAARSFGPDLLRLATETAAAVVRKVGVAVPTAEDLVAIRAR